MVSRGVLATAVAALLLAPAAGHAAAKRGTFAGSLGVKVPKGAEADVRAVNRASGAVALAQDVPRSGRFTLSLAKGTYLVIGTVVTPSGKVIRKDVGVSLKPGQKRRGSTLTARKRKRKPRGRAAFVQELGQITPGRVAVELHDVTGSVGDPEWDVFRPGINDVMLSDAMEATKDCGTAFLEVDRRDEIIKELEFQQSPYVDPSTRVTRNFIIGDVEVRGTMTAASGGRVEVKLTILEKSSRAVLGGRSAVLDKDGVFDQITTLAKQIGEDLCNLSDLYEVTLDVTGEGRFATHVSTGTMHAVLRPRRSERGRDVWRATGPLAWGGVTFTSKIDDCAYIDPIVPAVSWSVTILDAGHEQLSVTWGLSGSDGTTASVDCAGDPDPPPYPGQPGVALLTTGPEAFYVPYAGGTQAISGVIEDGGDGYFNSGTIKVEPAGIG